MVGAPTPLPGAQVPVLLEYERAEEWVRPQWGLQPALPPRLSPELTSGGGVGSQLLPVGSHSGGGGRKAGGDKARLHTCRPRIPTDSHLHVSHLPSQTLLFSDKENTGLPDLLDLSPG